ncbi:MAG: lysylphosphatidylglycerol synthase domain-containing protein [bacterium]
MQIKIKDSLKTVLKIAIALLILFFLIAGLFRTWNQIDLHKLNFRWLPLLLSVPVLMLYFCFFVACWLAILKNLGAELPFSQGFKIVFYSQLGKYLPGKFWVLAAKVLLCQKLAISKSTSFFAIGLEVGLTTVAGILVFLTGLLMERDYGLTVQPVYLGMTAILLLVAVHPKILSKVLNFFLTILKKEKVKIELTFSQLATLLGYYFLNWLCFGIAFFFLVNSISSFPFMKVPILAGSFAISVVVGMVSIFAPGGIGVREGVLVLFLHNFFPLPLAIAISLISRLWITLVELIMVGISAKIKWAI